MSKIEEICTVSFVDHEAASDLLREFTGKEGGLATVDWYLLRNRIADAISMTRIDEREKCRQLLSEAETREREARVKAPFEFNRYINGKLMAEGVRIERIELLEDAMIVAAKIASRGPNGEVPVLVLRSEPSARKRDAASIRAQAVEDVLSALTAHELYQYRPKAFQGFIDYARSALQSEER